MAGNEDNTTREGVKLDYQTPRPPPARTRGRGYAAMGTGAGIAGLSLFFVDLRGSGWDNACPSTFFWLGLIIFCVGFIRWINS